MSFSPEQIDLLKMYADGKITWSSLQNKDGFQSYQTVLKKLAEHGLTPPRAKFDEGANAASRAKGRGWLEQIIRERLNEK